ncbi:MAG: hypothetical protein NTZ13_01820 [Candidatus Parcubacteria bacterium]|nr:hypothetical protein [Candidatus Parcubacteria bacterium]
MKGDTNKLSRGEKLFQRISQGEKFTHLVENIRKNYKISTEGFSFQEDITDWYAQHSSGVGSGDYEEFKDEINKLLMKNALPVNQWWWTRATTHILSGDKVSFLPPLHSFQHPFVEMMDKHVGRDGSYTDIRLYEGAVQRDMDDFMSENWGRMKPSYRVGTIQKIRKESPVDIEINKEADFLLRHSKSDLGIKNTTKEIAVSGHLTKKYGKKITSDSVKMRVQRLRRKKR